MAVIVLALGLVLCVEGLVFALAPSRLEDLLRTLAEMPSETRRMVGLGALAAGVLLVWLAKVLGA
ncbi:DUF2065 domain-containing protein [Psychromarinibacter sp. C21-152]|uniref:DUF2065 domain-containing protein n=1 Tax=Psychromarinibacter sediminicola TaxID=3033385 RepID=A0AAE3NQT9_9RHOB|nr:DUF2065 domain-containing protein [Psychromarinibacter sediminicola]MDF0599969.1 DUF2065 domain-containing protein [Psychromarinibacter sediminicola]